MQLSPIAATLALCALSTGARAQTDQLVAPGTTWSYLDDGSDQGSAWADPLFDDSTWATGPAELGYGDGDEATDATTTDKALWPPQDARLGQLAGEV